MVAVDLVTLHPSAVDHKGSAAADNRPSGKVVAASFGSGLGGALGTVTTWAIVSSLEPPPIPGNVHDAIALLTAAACSAMFAGLFGYFKRPDQRTVVIFDRQLRPRCGRRKG